MESLTGEINHIMTREIDRLMQNLNRQIQKAITSAINDRIIPKI